jgi:hypothetical protein
MDQEHRDYFEDDRTGRRIDWEHGMAPVFVFVFAACVVVLGPLALFYLRPFLPFLP